MEYARTWYFTFDIYRRLGIQEKNHMVPIWTIILTRIWNLQDTLEIGIFYSDETDA